MDQCGFHHYSASNCRRQKWNCRRWYNRHGYWLTDHVGLLGCGLGGYPNCVAIRRNLYARVFLPARLTFIHRRRQQPYILFRCLVPCGNDRQTCTKMSTAFHLEFSVLAEMANQIVEQDLWQWFHQSGRTWSEVGLSPVWSHRKVRLDRAPDWQSWTGRGWSGPVQTG